MPLKFKSHIENLFKNSSNFSDSEGNLYIPKILNSIEKIDINLIKILKSDEKARENFFIKIDDIYVLNQNKLIEFFTLNDYMKNGSYTSYTNKIGLIKKDNFIKKFDDVILAFPHKDCILEGRQTKDDKKSQEVFYNEIISSDEIVRLFEPKVLTNIKRYKKGGIEKNPTIKDNDNLIIKGNNLIVLHSLKKRFVGKVKLIYIDPPYNTGNDSFNYNDNFNHSTWLTFMKNRLEVAREFLSDDGVIFVQCDDNEQAYLKVLMDEIFGRENFASNIITKATPNARDYGLIAQMHEHILLYAKNINFAYTHLIEIEDKKFNYEDEKGEFNIHPLYNSNVAFNVNNRKNLYYPFYVNPIKKDKNGFYEICLENRENWIEIYPPKSVKDNVQFVWRWGFNKSQENINIDIVGYKTKDKEFRIVQKMRGTSQLARSIWDSTEFSNRRATEDLQKLFSEKIFSFPKSEYLVKRIIEISTQPNDLIMDFHLGSGTTCAVAHKMNRRYIGIEQMGYIENIAVERLKKVIDGEQGGISKAVNWDGGGEFVYAELKQIDDFKDCEIGSLNKNMQYLPISEIEDESYNISKEEIAINKAFYGIENE